MTRTNRSITRLAIAAATLAFFNCTPSQADTKRIRVSGPAMVAKCKKCPRPAYPSAARDLRVQGMVEIYVLVAPDGAVQQARLISGHPLLAQSALDTVKRWKFEPSLSPEQQRVEVETDLGIRFELQK